MNLENWLGGFIGVATVYAYSVGLAFFRMIRTPGSSQGLNAVAGGAQYVLIPAVLVFVLGSYLSSLIAH